MRRRLFATLMPTLTFALWAGFAAGAEATDVLTPGDDIRVPLSGGQSLVYRVELNDHRFARFEARQEGIDVVIHVDGPEGHRLVSVDTWTGRHGPETVLLERSRGGWFDVQVASLDELVAPGFVRLSITPIEPVTADNQVRIQAERAMMQGAAYTLEDSRNSRRLAIEEFSSAISLWQRLESPDEEARANFNLGTNLEPDDPQGALPYYRRALDLWRESGDRTGEALALNFIGLVHQATGNVQSAIESYEASRSIRRELGDTYYEAQAAHNIGQMYRKLGNPRLAMRNFQEALDVLQGTADLRRPPSELQTPAGVAALEQHFNEAGNLRLSITVLDGIALVNDTLGEARQAIDYWQNALFLARLANADAELARIHNNAGAFYSKIGELQEGLDHYAAALEYFASERGNRYWEAWTRHNMGGLYSRLGDPARALDYLERALELRVQVGDASGQAQTLAAIGLINSQSGAADVAVEYYTRSLALREQAPDLRQEGVTLDRLGLAYQALGKFSLALSRHEQAAAVLHVAEATREEAAAIGNQGRALLSLGNSGRALERFSTALALHQKMRDPSLEAQTRFEIARAMRAMGQFPEALEQLETAISLIESLRTELIAPSLRASFLATQLDVFTFYVDTLMELGMRGNDPNLRAQAFAAAERGRSRSLLDYLSSSTSEHPRIDPGLLERRNALRQQLNAKEERRLELAGMPDRLQEIEDTERITRELTGQLEAIDTEIRRGHAHAAGQAPVIATLADVQALLEPDDLLVEYAIGQERSFAWVIGRDFVEASVLPSATELDDVVRRAFSELRNRNSPSRDSTSGVLDELANIVLSPVTDRRGYRRLIFVPDGALHYIPFGALPDPASSGEPLLVKHEVVIAPSASGLLALRQRERPAAPRDLRVAVLADPVFQLGDSRLGQQAGGKDGPTLMQMDPDLERSAADIGWNGFSRLPATRLEAETIGNYVAEDRLLLLLDFDANRSQVLGGALDDYQVLHFATHGIVNASHPGLSGLVLSGVNAEGQPLPAFLRAHDLYFSQLGAELVVLSACETAIGKQIRGEGIVGLTQSFFYAGASTVVSSLWQVPDRATSRLMGHFYRELLQNGQTPAAALRLAQLEIRGERRWRDPYFWAAFIVQGDWR